MTAKHRGKGKSNHKHEENSFRQEALESEARGGGHHYTLLFILFLMIVIGSATAAWFCFQQHQTITYLADNLMGMQMKMVKLQSFQEEIRQSTNKQASEGLELRLNALEESYALAQKQVGVAMATAEQLKTSDLPAQVLSLHTEMKARLSEMQQATVSLDQLSQLQATITAKNEEFEGVKLELEGLSGASVELGESVEELRGGLAAAESRLEEREVLVGSLSTSLGGQASELLGLREQLSSHQAQLDAGALEVATVRELLETALSQWAQQAGVEEQLSTVRQSLQEQNSAAHKLQSELRAQLETIQKQMEAVPEPDAVSTSSEEDQAPPAAEEEEAQPEEAAVGEEVQEVAHLDGLPVEQEDSGAEEQTAPAEEEVPEEEVAEEQIAPAEEEVAEEQTAPVEEEVQDEEVAEEQTAPVEEEVQEEELAEEQTAPVEEEVPEEKVAEEQTAPAEEEVQEEEVAEEEQEKEVPEEQAAPAEEEDLAAPAGEEEVLDEEVAEEQTAPAEEEDLAAPAGEEEVLDEEVAEEQTAPAEEEDLAAPAAEEVLEGEEESLGVEEQELYEGAEETEEQFVEEEEEMERPAEEDALLEEEYLDINTSNT